ncbi:MAG: hypothetical protein H0Z24_03465 [Thermosipho sp. (in: Bacteria)]|nr:hypothetical protein [Thermosipho sp. (in: thermotogales)]
MLKKIKKFHMDESGDIMQTGIIVGMFATIAVGALYFLGPKIKQMFVKAGNELDNSSNYTY